MRVFITGASSGIGEALARGYRARDPQAVIGLLARRGDELERIAGELGADRTPVWAVDVTDRAALAAAASDFIARHGPPDVVIASAGISAGTVTGEAGDAQVFERILRTNLVAMFDTFSPFVAAMKAARTGALVGIASVAGVRGLPGGGGYSASKAAVTTYLESLRVELRGSGLRVVTVCPGYIATAMTEVLSDEVKAEFTRQIPLGRMGLPADIAAAVAFLASEEAGYITGCTIPVNGGMLMP